MMSEDESQGAAAAVLQQQNDIESEGSCGTGDWIGCRI